MYNTNTSKRGTSVLPACNGIPKTGTEKRYESSSLVLILELLQHPVPSGEKEEEDEEGETSAARSLCTR